MSTSGYTNCACRDCFEIAVSDDMSHPDLCLDCEEAGCDKDGNCGCSVEPEDTYDYQPVDGGETW